MSHTVPAMSEPLALSMGQQFEVERMGRAIDATQDIEALRELTKQVVRAWFCQKAATLWVIRQQTTPAEALVTELSEGELLGFGDDGVDLAGTLG